MNNKHQKLEGLINYKFKQQKFLVLALTHASNNKNIDNNERLEFLGDRVLGLALSEHLFQNNSSFKVGDMAQHLSYLASRNICAQVASTLKLLGYADTAKGISAKFSDNLAVHANLCEALIGAIYLDGGLEPAREFVKKFWCQWLSQNLNDGFVISSKNALQEAVQSLGFEPPNYSLVSRSGPDHTPIFVVKVESGKLGEVLGEGSSLQNAEKTAAKKFLKLLEKNNNGC